MPDSPVPPDEVRQQVARIVASTGFGRSELLARFLRFIVESALRGEAEKLKEWVIGVEAYGRGPDFDPRVDSIVRTEARRLRRKLSEYYASEGGEDPIVIGLPTGSYEPVFRLRGEGAPPEAPVEEETEEETAEEFLFAPEARALPSRRSFLHVLRRMPGILRYAAVVLLTCAVWFVYEHYFARHRDPVHVLALLPVSCIPEGQDCQALGNAFLHELGINLETTGVLHVIEPEATSHLTSLKTPISQMGSQLKADHVFRADLERSGAAWHLTVEMIRAADEAPVWTGGFDCSWGTVAGDKSEVLNDILTYASVNSNGNQRTHGSLLQVRRAEHYRLYAGAEYAFAAFTLLREKVYSDYAAQQLNQILRLDPDFNDARVLLARLNIAGLWGAPDRMALLREGQSLLEAAVKLEPKRADANALLASIYWELGQRDRGVELARRSLLLGPLDATAHAELGRIYTEAGFFEAAIDETTKALALDPTNLEPLGLQIVCLSWLGRQNGASEALNKFREWHPGTLANLFTVDQDLSSRNFEEAGRLISSGREAASAENRAAFDIAEGLRAALTGNRAEATRIFDQYKNSPPRFWDHIILLAAQLGDGGSAVQFIRQNPLYFNYHYLAVERRLAPLRTDPNFQALLFESYGRWQHDLSRYGPGLPAPQPLLPSPQELLTRP